MKRKLEAMVLGAVCAVGLGAMTVESADMESPWKIGEGVTAYTNGAALAISGAGTVASVSAAIGKDWDAVKAGLEAITIAEATVTGATSEAFKGFDGVVLTLPDGWQGKLPDVKDDWYGATDVLLMRMPMAVKNVKVLPRYPWNGLVDVAFDVTGTGTVAVAVQVMVDGEKIANPTVTGETTFDLDEDGEELRDLKLTWDAKSDFGDEDLHEKIKVKLAVASAEE